MDDKIRPDRDLYLSVARPLTPDPGGGLRCGESQRAVACRAAVYHPDYTLRLTEHTATVTSDTCRRVRHSASPRDMGRGSDRLDEGTRLCARLDRFVTRVMSV